MHAIILKFEKVCDSSTPKPILYNRGVGLHVVVQLHHPACAEWFYNTQSEIETSDDPSSCLDNS